MLGNLEKTQAIIFDMDGVLFLSTDCHEEAFCLTIEGYLDDFDYRDIAGMRTDEAFRFLWEKNHLSLDEAELERLVQQKREYAIKFLRERSQVAAGVPDILKSLAARYRLVLATSASAPTAELFFSLSKSREFFEHVLDGSTVTSAKPDPAIYLLAAEKLGLAPEKCVVIEDAIKGAEAAFRAGIPLIVVAPPEKEAHFLQFKPVMVLSEVQEVAQILLS